MILLFALWAEARLGLDQVGMIILGLLAAIPASELGVALVNRLVTTGIPPRVMPRFELKGGVPATLKSIVVVPMLLTVPAGPSLWSAWDVALGHVRRYTKETLLACTECLRSSMI